MSNEVVNEQDFVKLTRGLDNFEYGILILLIFRFIDFADKAAFITSEEISLNSIKKLIGIISLSILTTSADNSDLDKLKNILLIFSLTSFSL